MKEYFKKNGYINIPWFINRPLPWQLVIAGRGTGKTYNGIEYCLKELPESRQFIFMRRTQTQVDLIKNDMLSPFTPVDPFITVRNINKHIAGVYKGILQEDGSLLPDGQPLGMVCALSTIANIRGFNTQNVDIVLFDELTGEEHERPIKGERNTLLKNAYETINRNRELDGMPPVKLLMFCNADRIDAPILYSFGAPAIISRMIKRGQDLYENYKTGVGIYIVGDSPISKAKANTALYRLDAGTDFSRMALDNTFVRTETDIKPRPLLEYKPIFSFDNLEILKHKSSSRQNYYCRRLARPSADLLTAKQQKSLIMLYKAGKIDFASSAAKNIFISKIAER